MKLPPGQHAIKGFPRFGTHLHRPPPPIPDDPTIEVGGAVTEPLVLPLADLASLPRREQVSDFHCVAGWSAIGLRWEGVAFETFYREVVEPVLEPGAEVSHVVFRGLDGYRCPVALEDALQEDVMLAEHLDGAPLDSDHGAPVRLVTPRQYGFVNVKHLCGIDVRTARPAQPQAKVTLRTPLIKRHPRARVWEEERHPDLPAKPLRPIYRLLIPPIKLLCKRGSRS